MSPASLDRLSKPSKTVADELRLRLNVLIALQVAIALVLGGVVWYFAVQASRAHEALCNLRTDQVQRLVGTQDFLAKHPEGIPGISRATLEQSVTNSKVAVKALDNLGCPAVKIG